MGTGVAATRVGPSYALYVCMNAEARRRFSFSSFRFFFFFAGNYISLSFNANFQHSHNNKKYRVNSIDRHVPIHYDTFIRRTHLQFSLDSV